MNIKNKRKKYINRLNIINNIGGNCNFIKEIINNIVDKINDNEKVNVIFPDNISYMKIIILPLIKNNHFIL